MWLSNTESKQENKASLSALYHGTALSTPKPCVSNNVKDNYGWYEVICDIKRLVPGPDWDTQSVAKNKHELKQEAN